MKPMSWNRANPFTTSRLGAFKSFTLDSKAVSHCNFIKKSRENNVQLRKVKNDFAVILALHKGIFYLH